MSAQCRCLVIALLASISIGCGLPVVSEVGSRGAEGGVLERELHVQTLLLEADRRLAAGDPAGALEALDGASLASPRDARVFYGRGLALQASGDEPGARLAYGGGGRVRSGVVA